MDHGIRALASVLHTGSRKALLELTTKLTPEHFRDPAQSLIFKLLDAYYLQTGGILKVKILRDILVHKGWEESKILPVEQAFALAVQTEVSADEVLYSVQVLRDSLEHEKTGQAITTGFEILDSGVTFGESELRGAEHASEYLLAELSKIRQGGADAPPEGDVRTQVEEILAAYYEAQKGERPGIATGMPTVDRVISGLAPGELMLVAAFTGSGKSQWCVQQAWRAAVLEGKNIYYATTETLRQTIVNRLVARHTRLPQFGVPDGLDSKKIETGKLSPAEFEVFRAALDDLKNNEAYGKIYIAQVGSDARLSWVRGQMQRLNQQWPIEYSVVDSINLLRPEVSRPNQQHELVSLLQDAKQLARSFDNGRGVPLVSPWQMSISAYTNALDLGQYTLHKSLADTSEAQKTPDVVLSLLRSEMQPKRATLQILKARNADLPQPIELRVDYRNSWLEEQVSASEDEGAFGI